MTYWVLIAWLTFMFIMGFLTGIYACKFKQD